MITQERLKQLFLYDPETGHLINKSGERRRVGKSSGSLNSEGYVNVFIEGRQYKAHRLVWCFVFGEWIVYPDYEIDHVNGDKADNRIQNLRKCTKSMNQRNGSMRVNNKSGVIGVNWKSKQKVWVARIWDGPHHKFLGNFKQLDDAREARAKAERELGYHPGHGKPSQAA